MIDRYFEFVKSNGYFERRRNQQARYWMMETIDEQLRNNFYRNPEVNELLMEREARVLSNRQSSFTAAKDVLDFYFRKFEK